MITLQDNGQVTFEFFRPEAQEVHLVGSHNDWSHSKHPLQSQGNGWWTTTLTIDPADYTFKYLVDQQTWYADFAAHGLEADGLGSWQSILTVPEVTATIARPELLNVTERTQDELAPLPFQKLDLPKRVRIKRQKRRRSRQAA